MELPSVYGWIGATVFASWAVHHVFMAQGVMKARKKYDVKYPNLYAPPGHKNEHAFNCIQRGHQNALENLPTFYALLITAGLKHPVTASILGGVFLVGRLLYFQGYSTGDPNGRLRGAPQYIGILGLVGICVKMAVSAFMGK